MYISYQINQNNILHAIATHPKSVNTFLCLQNQTIEGLKLGMKYIEADRSFYELDENGDIINETQINIADYLL